MQASNLDPFASFGGAQKQQQPPQQQPAAAADPWNVPPPQAQPPAAPVQAAQVPAEVVADAGRQSPPSPMGEMSVLAQAAANQAAAAAAPALNNQQPVQPLQPVAEAPANPFAFGGMAGSLPPSGAPPAPPTQAPPAVPAPAPAQVPPMPQQQPAAPLSPVPYTGYVAPTSADPFGLCFSPLTSPVTSPGGSPRGSPGAMVPSAAPAADPYGVFGAVAPPPLAQQQQPAADPFGSSQPPAQAGGAPAVVDDPFGIFGAPTPAQQPAPPQAPAPAAPAQVADPWAATGFGQAAPAHPAQPPHDQASFASQPSASPSAGSYASRDKAGVPDVPDLKLDDTLGLPTTGEYYEARIAARTLGAMFYTPSDLSDDLLSRVPPNVVASLGDRPVVSYIAADSAAFNAGVHVGHVVLQVNGSDVSEPEGCAYAIREASRPMTLRCYIPPHLKLTVCEGKHKVKYDSREMFAPCTAIEWKTKYVTVGGIVAKPWMMNMYYSKRDYDIAIKEAHARRRISVKIKQFDLRGARIVVKHRDGKPNLVDYKTERKPWFYFTILPEKGYPIKISSHSLEGLEPVYAAVRKFVRKDMQDRYSGQLAESFGDDGTRGVNERFGERTVDSYWK